MHTINDFIFKNTKTLPIKLSRFQMYATKTRKLFLTVFKENKHFKIGLADKAGVNLQKH